MDSWIDLAFGPLLRWSLAACILGLAYRFGVAVWQLAAARRRSGDPDLPVRAIVQATVRWLLPVRLLRLRPGYGIASALFHAGLLALPLFYVGHVGLLRDELGAGWPALGPAVSDILTLVALAGLAFVLLSRLLVATSRQLTGAADVGLLVLLLVLLGSGWWASHPASSPLAPRAMLLVHALAGNLALVLTPFSKISHCVLFPLTQLAPEIGWRFPADSGRRVAVALAKENEPV
jgi:nitrate reductase gamma subunit